MIAGESQRVFSVKGFEKTNFFFQIFGNFKKLEQLLRKKNHTYDANSF